MTPASLVQTNAILKEFGQLVAEHAAEIRNMVVNKLILETESKKDSTRMQALISLGKMTDVGLFTDRKEITVTHQNSAELRQKLQDKLEVLKQNTSGVYEVVDEDIPE
jgi:electron transfer flavoprotein alpha/beta subunit